MTYKEALTIVEKFIQDKTPIGMTAKIYDYLDGDDTNLVKRPWAAIRVAEVSFFNERGGSSFMQVDLPFGLALCAQVERCILATIENWDDDGHEDGKEEFERLEYLLQPPKISKRRKA